MNAQTIEASSPAPRQRSRIRRGPRHSIRCPGSCHLEMANRGPTREWRQSRPAGYRLLGLSGILLVLIVAILVWARGWPFPNDNFPDTLWNGVGRAGFLIVVAVLGLMLQWFARSSFVAVSPAKPSRPGREKIGRFIPFLLLLVLWLDVWTHEPPQNPTVPP